MRVTVQTDVEIDPLTFASKIMREARDYRSPKAVCGLISGLSRVLAGMAQEDRQQLAKDIAGEFHTMDIRDAAEALDAIAAEIRRERKKRISEAKNIAQGSGDE